ncbi:MAG: hypothetical protein KHZ20_08545, partial [Collinsella sp.]|nr:hypothetical protein [Collinsella sp.]
RPFAGFKSSKGANILQLQKDDWARCQSWSNRAKQIARLSALWARKAASPFWKGKGEKGGAAAHLAA